jgi:hypothetical protein
MAAPAPSRSQSNRYHPEQEHQSATRGKHQHLHVCGRRTRGSPTWPAFADLTTPRSRRAPWSAPATVSGPTSPQLPCIRRYTGGFPLGGGECKASLSKKQWLSATSPSSSERPRSAARPASGSHESPGRSFTACTITLTVEKRLPGSTPVLMCRR